MSGDRVPGRRCRIHLYPRDAAACGRCIRSCCGTNRPDGAQGSRRDPQGSALDWAQRRAQSGHNRLYGVFGLARDSLHQEAPAIALQADFVVIDGPPRVAALARSALLAADLVLIPVQPSAYDVWASHEMVQLITEARVFRPQLRAAFVINRRVVGTVIGREARAALADQPFPALQVEVSQRILFADSVAAGRLAFEVAPNCAAAREIAALAQAVREMLL